jgi:hypothetical protein
MSNNKYYGRQMSYVSRDTSAIETNSSTPSWFEDFVKSLEKEAVQSRQEAENTADMISSILHQKSKYSSVEEAVLDMQRRTGLFDIINKLANIQTPKLLLDKPELKTFIDNYVSDRPGTAIDAVIYEIFRIKELKAQLPQNSDVPDDVKKYISEKIIESRALYPSKEQNQNLGKVDNDMSSADTHTSDPFGGCVPAK